MVLLEVVFFERASDASAEENSGLEAGTKMFVLSQGHPLAFGRFQFPCG